MICDQWPQKLKIDNPLFEHHKLLADRRFITVLNNTIQYNTINFWYRLSSLCMPNSCRSALSHLGGADAIAMQSIVDNALDQGLYSTWRLVRDPSNERRRINQWATTPQSNCNHLRFYLRKNSVHQSDFYLGVKKNCFHQSNFYFVRTLFINRICIPPTPKPMQW